MPYRLFAMLTLASWAQVTGDQRMLPESPPPFHAVHVLIGSYQPPRAVTIERPAPPDDDPPLARLDLLITNDLVAVERENFDRWLFNDSGQGKAARLRHLERILQAKLDVAVRSHHLTAPQRLKLRVAGRGDIKRFFDQVENRRNDFEIQRRRFNSGIAALCRLQPLSQLYREGPFGDGSLFAKMLHKINDDRKAGHT